MTALFGPFQSLGFAAESSARPAAEALDRKVDQVAIESQEMAIKKLRALVAKYQNRPQESTLRFRLAQVLQQSASIQFRISHQKSTNNYLAASLKKYKGFLQSSIDILDQLIEKFPDFESMDLCFSMRGHLNEELERKEEAKQDYLHLVHHFPNSDQVMMAYMALAQIATDHNNHPEAIQYLQQVEKRPSDPHFPFALYKLAWSHYNLNHISKALEYIGRHIRYYDLLETEKSHLPSPDHLTSSDSSIRDNSLMDAVTFYLGGAETEPSKYSAKGALDYFRSLNAGPILGRMAVRFAKILRTQRRDSELILWKNEMLSRETSRPETAEVLVTLLEYQMNQANYRDLMKTIEDLVDLYRRNDDRVRRSNSFDQARMSLVEISSRLQELALKNKEARAHHLPEADLLMNALSSVYSGFIQMITSDDPRVAQAHYNLAEVLFQIRKFANATEHYRWLLVHWNNKNGMSFPAIELKAIASRYETLREAHLIPISLEPSPLDHRSEVEMKGRLSTSLLEWMSWIDSFSGTSPQERQNLEPFLFELNRALYVQGSTKVSTQRLIEFSLGTSSPKYTIASAQLALDTYIVSQDWEATYSLSKSLLKRKWAENEFQTHLRTTAENSAYKILESYFLAKKTDQVLKAGERFLSEFPHGNRSPDCLLLMSQTQLEAGKKQEAEIQLSKLIHDFPASGSTSLGLFTRAQIREENYRFEEALVDYRTYLKMRGETPSTQANLQETPQKPAKESNQELEIRKKILFLQWITGDPPGFCGQNDPYHLPTALALDCEHYEGLYALNQSPPFRDEERAWNLAHQGPKENRAIWAAVVLRSERNIELGRRLKAIQILSRQWDQLDSLSRMILIPSLTDLIPTALASARTQLRTAVPLRKATSQAIARRAEWIKEIETTVNATLNLPWSRVRAQSLFELSQVYLDFEKTLRNLPLPTDLSPKEKGEYLKNVLELAEPFSKKYEKLAEQAYQIASESGVEGRIVQELLHKAPQSVKRVSEKASAEARFYQSYLIEESLDLNFLGKVDPLFATHPPSSKSHLTIKKASASELTLAWMSAYQGRQWARAGFLLQEFADKKLLDSTQLRLMRGLILIAMGAQAEGLLEIPVSSEDLKPEARYLLQAQMTSYYLRSGSLDKAKQLISQMENYLRSQKKRSQLLLPAQSSLQTSSSERAPHD